MRPYEYNERQKTLDQRLNEVGYCLEHHTGEGANFCWVVRNIKTQQGYECEDIEVAEDIVPMLHEQKAHGGIIRRDFVVRVLETQRPYRQQWFMVSSIFDDASQ